MPLALRAAAAAAAVAAAAAATVTRQPGNSRTAVTEAEHR